MHSANKDYNSQELEEIKIEVPFSLKYDRHVRELPYRRRENDFKPSLHIGQRKLLLNEIHFLTNYGHLSNLVVYAGGAPGTHINYLSTLFPNHKFELWDPNPFDQDLYKNEKIKIFNDYFTNETAIRYRRSNVIFWSDIRTVGENIEDDVPENMKMQAKWHRITNAVMSMLKFRLPYIVSEPCSTEQGPDTEHGSANEYTYLEGELYLQPWAPQTSTETRLVVKRDCGDRVYDPKSYESRMFRFNNITRIWQYFPHTISDIVIDKPTTGDKKPKTEYSMKKHGVDHCFDCRAEIYILAKYISAFNKLNTEASNSLEASVSDLEDSVAQMIKDINIHMKSDLAKHPHGFMPDRAMCEKYDIIKEKFTEAVQRRRQHVLKVKGIV